MLKQTNYPGIANVWTCEHFDECYIELTSEPVIELEVKIPERHGTYSVEGRLKASINQEWSNFFAQVNPCHFESRRKSIAEIYTESLCFVDLYERVVSSRLKKQASIDAALEEYVEDGKVFASAVRQREVVDLAASNVHLMIAGKQQDFLNHLQFFVVTRDWQWESPEIRRLLAVESELMQQLKQAEAATASAMRQGISTTIADWEMPDAARKHLVTAINKERSFLPGIYHRFR